MEKQRNFYIFTILLLMMACAVGNTTSGLFLNDFVSQYNLRSGWQGAVGSIQSAGNVFALAGTILIAAAIRKHHILYITVIFACTSFFLMGTKPIFVLLLAAYFCYGIAFGIQDVVASSIMVDMNPAKSKQYIGLLHGFFGIGGLSGPLMFGMLQKAGLPWNVRLLILASLFLIAGLMHIFASQNLSGSNVQNFSRHKTSMNEVMEYVRDKKKRLLAFAAIAYGAHQIGVTGWMQRYVSVELHSKNISNYTISLFWLGVMLIRFIAPHLPITRIGILISGNLLSAASLFVGFLVHDGRFMLVACSLAGFFEGAVVTMLLDIGCNLSPENTTLASSIMLGMQYIGFIIAPVLIGWAVGHFGFFVGMIQVSAWAVVSAACAIWFAYEIRNGSGGSISDQIRT